jgi:hypothetical protein
MPQHCDIVPRVALSEKPEQGMLKIGKPSSRVHVEMSAATADSSTSITIKLRELSHHLRTIRR